MAEGLWMTQVGSLPKPDYILEARSMAHRGLLTPEELLELEQRATQEWIEFQDEIGVDIVVDGEMYRGDMVAYFAEHLIGFEEGGLVRSYGNRYYRKPIATGPAVARQPLSRKQISAGLFGVGFLVARSGTTGDENETAEGKDRDKSN